MFVLLVEVFVVLVLLVLLSVEVRWGAGIHPRRTAATLHQLVLTADQGNLGTTRITVTYADHAYVLSLADKRIHVVKKTVGSSEALA